MTEPLSSIVHVSSLFMRRDDAVLLRDVSWEVAPGQHWVVLGPNGSGKTSLLGTLTAYLPPSEGSVEVLGQRYGASDFRALRRRIGVVSSAIHPHLWEAEASVRTVASGKFAAFGPWAEPTDADLSHAAELLERARASHVADRPFRVLSQGERQRVLIARALMAEPELLILDEPCAGLDPVAREQLLRVIQDLAGESRPTMLFVTHHIEEVVPAFSHVLVLSRGSVVAQGKKQDVLTSEVLSKAFAWKVKVVTRGDRFELTIGEGQ